MRARAESSDSGDKFAGRMKAARAHSADKFGQLAANERPPKVEG